MTLLEHIIQSNSYKGKQSIQRWQQALRQAENIDRPRRALLIGIYKDILLDPHLSAQINLRKLKTLGSENNIKNDKGEAIENTPDFYHIIDMLLDSVFFGHSLLQIDIEDSQILPSLLPRSHVVPEQGLLLKNVTDDTGIHYRDSFAGKFIETTNTDSLGLLNQCVPYVLYKRFTTSAWAEFCEIFGMPLRIGKTSTRDGRALSQMEQMMINMGSAAYGVIDHDDDVQFYESKKTDGNIYDSLINHCNSEMSKVINGAVIGEDSENGSRSKEEVGERLGDFLSKADQKMVENVVNTQLLPIVGISGTFGFEKSKDLKALWKMTAEAMPYFDVDEEFITKNFGIPVKQRQNKTKLSENTRQNDPDSFFA